MNSPQISSLKNTLININRMMKTTMRPQAAACVRNGLVCKVPQPGAKASGAASGIPQPPADDDAELKEICKILKAIELGAQQTQVDMKCGVIVV
jgi:hypothetical protein